MIVRVRKLKLVWSLILSRFNQIILFLLCFRVELSQFPCELNWLKQILDHMLAIVTHSDILFMFW